MRMTKKRKQLLSKIRKDAAAADVDVDWDYLNMAPFAFVQFASIMLQLHKK